MAEDEECCKFCLNKEFEPESIGFAYEQPRDFTHAQWSWLGGCRYVVYRVLTAALFGVWVAMDFMSEARRFYSHNYMIWFIFATNWSILLLAFLAIVHAIIVLVHYSRKRDMKTPDQHKMSYHLIFLWCLHTIATNSAVVVSFSYWTFLVAMDHSGFLITPMSRLKHTLNTLYVLIDLFLTRMPVRVFHLVYPLSMGAVYAVFNATYFINDGTGPNGHPYAYHVMDWRNPILSSLACAAGFIISSIIQVILFGLYKLRLRLAERFHQHVTDTLCSSDSSDENSELQPIIVSAAAARTGSSSSQEGDTVTYNAVQHTAPSTAVQ